MWTNVEGLGLATTISNLIQQWDVQFNRLPDLREASDIFISSDYSGDHRGSLYRVISFLIADARSWKTWESERKTVRALHLLDGRRMSFKSLADRRRSIALRPFLQAASCLRGVCATFAIHRSVTSLFATQGKPNPIVAGFPLQAKWSPNSFERVLRVVHLLSILIAGVSSPRQNVLWMTDNDDIVATLNHHNDTVRLLANISSHYLTHTLGHLRVATATSDTGDRQIEDLLSIPDLVAGCVAQLLTEYELTGGIPGGGLLTSLSQAVNEKTRLIASWLSLRRRPLCTLVFQLGFTPTRTRWNLRILDFTSA